jgi:hypothetical protein
VASEFCSGRRCASASAEEDSETSAESWLEAVEHKMLAEWKHRAAHRCRRSESARRWTGAWRITLGSGKVLSFPLPLHSEGVLILQTLPQDVLEVPSKSIVAVPASQGKYRALAGVVLVIGGRRSLNRSLATRVAAVVRFAK